MDNVESHPPTVEPGMEAMNSLRWEKDYVQHKPEQITEAERVAADAELEINIYKRLGKAVHNFIKKE